MTDERQTADEIGFELGGDFYPLTVNVDNGKDLMLIDRLTSMPTEDFRDAISDGAELGRGPIMLAVLACSIRARHPSWTIERILRIVTGDLAELTFIGAADDQEVETSDPPADAASQAASQQPSAPTASPSAGSSPPSTPPESSSSETLYAIPA